MGQRDPTTEWQREGFDLFGQLTDLIGADFLRYVMRIRVTVADEEGGMPDDVQTSGPEGPVGGAAAVADCSRCTCSRHRGTPRATQEGQHRMGRNANECPVSLRLRVVSSSTVTAAERSHPDMQDLLPKTRRPPPPPGRGRGLPTHRRVG